MLRAFALTNTALNSHAQLWTYVDVLRYFALNCAPCITFPSCSGNLKLVLTESIGLWIRISSMGAIGYVAL